MNIKSTLVVLTFLLPLFLNGCGGGGSTADLSGTAPTEREDGSTADLSWVAPTEREDGSVLSLSAIAGYRIYYGVEKGIYPGQIDINDHTASQAQLSGFPSGKYFVVMTTIDTDGRESIFSLEVEMTK